MDLNLEDGPGQWLVACSAPAQVSCLGAALIGCFRTQDRLEAEKLPSGTPPIDQVLGLDRDDVHDIKGGVGVAPNDWTGITPEGHVITGDSKGNAVDNGSYGPYLL